MNSEAITQFTEFNTVDLRLKGFKVYEIETSVHPLPSYSRKDFFKICLANGHSSIQYADREITIDGWHLFFGNPHIPYSSELVSGEMTGYACLFTEEFLIDNNRSRSLHESPLFRIGGTPVFLLNEEHRSFLSTIFKKMLSEQSTDYLFKNELIRNYINLIIHEAMKMQPSDHFFRHKNASSRITSFFLELLERQFPIESTEQPLRLRTAQDFARDLSVHVNHLNRSVKEVTGKSTTTHISHRIVGEARALLRHTDWSIADIAYALGFEYPTYFNNYFKRITGTVPKSLRE